MDIAQGAKFEIDNGAKLIIRLCTLDACMNHTWDGIHIIEDNAELEAIENHFYHADNAIYSTNGGNYIVRNNEFNACYNSLTVDHFNGDHPGVFYKNTIKCTLPLLPNSTGITQLTGIKIDNVVATSPNYKLLIGDTDPANLNVISEQSDISIDCNNSDVEIINADIDITNCNYGIYFLGGTLPGDLRDISLDYVDIHTSGLSVSNSAVECYDNFNTVIQNCSLITNSFYNVYLFNAYCDLTFENNYLAKPIGINLPSGFTSL